MLSNFRFAVIAVLSIAITAFAASSTKVEKPGFFRFPHTDGKFVVFTSEGDLWKVPIQGGEALRMTTLEGEERLARFSPDGKWIAFTAQEDGQDDVFVIPAAGGQPRRLTHHPDRDQVVGWTPDHKILFRSTRDIPYRGYRIYTVPFEGGFQQSVGLDKAALISFEPNGKRVAFNRYSREFRYWKRYKGGWAQDIWVGNITNIDFKNVTQIPEVNLWDGTDAFPMWHANGRIYFLSDRAGRGNIHSMLPSGEDVKQHTFHDKFDVRWPSLGGNAIVYQHGMDIWAFDIATNKTSLVDITLPTDRAQARTRFVNPRDYITALELSPDGKRLLLCSRGELFTLPVKGQGLIRQLTWNSGIREKMPHWTPDGKNIVYWSDEDGEEKLYQIPAEGGKHSLITSDKRGWHFPALTSPDGKWVVYSNEELELVVVDLKNGKTRVIDTAGWEIREYSWSPDSRFIVYSRPEANGNNIVLIWDSQTNNIIPVTNDYFNSHSPSFDPDGKYLYFLSDRISNPRLDGNEFIYALDKRTKPYLAVLKKDQLYPFASEADPKSRVDEEAKPDSGKGDKPKDKSKDKDLVKVTIDHDGLTDRIIPFPVEAGNYGGLTAVSGKIFYLSWERRGMLGWDDYDDDAPRGMKLHQYNLERKKAKVIAEGIRTYDISRNQNKLLVWKDDQFIVSNIDDDFNRFRDRGNEKNDRDEQDNVVNLSQWDLRVDVRAEWKQMFRESWRLQRDFFWEPNLHQVNWQSIFDQYAPLADRISTRDELNDLIGEMFAELNCSHTYVWGGDHSRPKYRRTGLLGADISLTTSDFYRIDRIIKGRSWDASLSSPLSAPGINAKEGDYITHINGRPVNEVTDIYELLLDKADKIISLTLNDKPSLDGGWEIIIKPMGSENGLRYWDWVDGRRQYVHDKSNGQIAYIHLSDMGGFGLSQFAEAYMPQHRKPAMILDVRYNGGGFVAQMILSHLGRKLFAVGRPRHGENYRYPNTAFHGHMAAICNGETGSDGETFTEGFRRIGLGKVIGTRTWGGWVGIRSDKPLVDRGVITQPEFTGWGISDGAWMIEGWGSVPDIEVEEDPNLILSGADPQLDFTIKYLKDLLDNDPKVIPNQPAYPDRSGW